MFKSIREVHDAYDKKSLLPSDLTQHYLKAAEASKTGAFITVCKERALHQAQQVDQILKKEGKVPRQRMPLFGIPIAIKDLLTIDGVRTTCASKILDQYVPPYTATAVQRLEKSGGISVGKTNMDEFAMGGSNENSAYGPVQHPTHADRVPGGSSGGSATAVKGDLAFAALGTDTGGSIRLPSSYCGIVGLKPSYGRISRYGQVAFASTLDQIGPMTRTVEDAALLLDVMSGHDPLDSTSAPLGPTQTLAALQKDPDWSRIRIGIPKEYWASHSDGSGVNPEVEKAIQKSMRWFEAKGARLVPISLPNAMYSVAIYYLLAVSEASSNLARFDGVRFGTRPSDGMEVRDLNGFYKHVRSLFGSEVKRRIILGTFALSSGYADAYYKRACQVRRLVKNDFDRAFTEVDLILGPVAPTTAFKLGEKVRDPLQMYLNDIFTIPANLVGLPAISLPCGQDSQGLPIGLHLMSPQFTEDRLLSVAHAFEVNYAS